MSDFASRIAFPRPISAKKKNKFQLFSPVVSCSRLRTVQRLLKCGNNPQAKLSGILCILGIDSRYNGGARRLLNYLLFGFCELTPADVSHSRISDEELEDVVVVVKAESVHVYCNPVNYPLLLPLIAHWRNLHIYCLSHEEYKDDEERAEEFKITSFISMVDGSERIGIPYADGSVGEHQPAFDPFILEKWPLVQAYALEGFGSGGFFTMNHEVFDISQDLQRVYGLLDPVGIETLVTETLPLFERHCKSVLTNVDIESCNDLSEVTERSLSEPIVSYFNHGHISETENGKSSSASCQPFVLLGCNSSRKLLRNPEKLSSRNNNSTLSNSGVDGSQAKHMVCFAVEPRGTIACARTYFLQNGFVPLQLEADKQSHYVTSKDTRLLMDLYLLCVSAVEEGIKTFSQTFSKQQSLSSVRSHLQLGIQEKEIKLNPSFLSSNMEFTLDACDCLGRNITLQEDKPHPVIKRVCLYLYDVPSVEHPGKSLGSVVFGESFLDSAVKMLIPDSPSVWSSSVVFLTESIPIFVSWLGSGLERQASMEMTAFAKSKAGNNLLGKQLLSGNEVFMLSSVNKWEEGSLFIYEQGFLFIHPRLGVILLPTTKLSKLCFYDEGSTSVTALLMLTYQSGLQGNLPSYLADERSSLVLALSPRSRIYRQFYSDVLHLWKGDQLTNMPPFEVTTDLPAHLSRLHLNLQQQLKLSFRRETVYGLSSAEAFLPSLKGFLSHFSVSSSLGDRPVNCKDLPVLLGSSLSEQKQSQDLELLLTILTGVPESGKDGLCLALVALAKENSKWVIIQRPVGQADPFDPKALQKSLSNILTSQRRQHARLSATKRRLRVIIVTPGFTDVIDVTQAITTHPDHEVAKCLKIGAVTCCVDPLNTFMENRLTLPKLLEQCAQGWVNNVVFTSCLEPQNEQLSLTQKLVRASNPDVAFILAKGGEVTRTPDVELILSDSAYDEEKMVQKRHLMCPGWSLGLFSSGSTEPLVNEICVPLYGPLDRLRFVANLKAIQGPISGKGIVKSGAMHSLQGLIYFSEGDIQREVHIRWARLNGALRMTAVDSSAVPRPPSSKGQSNGTTDDIHQYFIVFTGFNLQEQNLKDWLKTCCKPAPVKQKLKVKKDLSDKEITDITTKHKFDPLPPGWFYNGAHYVSLTGEKDNNHPLLQTFIESYILRINEDIEQHNIKIDSQQPAVDIFEKPTSSS